MDIVSVRYTVSYCDIYQIHDIKFFSCLIYYRDKLIPFDFTATCQYQIVSNIIHTVVHSIRWEAFDTFLAESSDGDRRISFS